MKRAFYAAAIAASFVGTAAFGQVINIASSNGAGGQATPVTQLFDAGTYSVQVVGKAGGGIYDAWGIATPAAGNFVDQYNYSYDNTNVHVDPTNGARFNTAAEALAANGSYISSFTLAAATTVSFFIPDTWFFDNTDGASVKVTKNAPTPVPEPATMGLFALGGAALLARRRKRGLAVG